MTIDELKSLLVELGNINFDCGKFEFENNSEEEYNQYDKLLKKANDIQNQIYAEFNNLKKQINDLQEVSNIAAQDIIP